MIFVNPLYVVDADDVDFPMMCAKSIERIPRFPTELSGVFGSSGR
jgi:hypothetical protein